MQDRLTLSRQRLIQARAHGLRSSVTPSEMLLWSCLRARQLGVQFRRQVPLLNRFVVDWWCPHPSVLGGALVRMESARSGGAACGRSTSPKHVLAGAAPHGAAMVKPLGG
jgi:hypothetical protein